MNKLLQTTLIAGILSTGAMAGETTGALPQTIELGATVYVNKDIDLSSPQSVTIDNYGAINTEVPSSEPCPVISNMRGTFPVTINNHGSITIEQETNELNANKIKTDNAIDGVILDKVYKVVEGTDGTIDPNIIIGGGVTVINETSELKVFHLGSYTAKDILFLGAESADKTARLRGNQDSTCPFINCNLGDQGGTNSYNLEIVEGVNIGGDISNYRNGSITLKKDGEYTPILGINSISSKQDLHVPITVESGVLCINGELGIDIYGDISIQNEGTIEFIGQNTLKPGAILRIGEVQTTDE